MNVLVIGSVMVKKLKVPNETFNMRLELKNAPKNLDTHVYVNNALVHIGTLGRNISIYQLHVGDMLAITSGNNSIRSCYINKGFYDAVKREEMSLCE